MYLKHIVNEIDQDRKAADVLVERTGMSRLMVKKIRLHGQLLVNGQPHRMIDPVHSGDVMEINLANREGPVHLRRHPDIPVLFQDEWLIVVSKPADLVIHPTYLHHQGSLTDRLSDQPLHPVLRLDRDTTGAVLIALNGHAHHVLSSHPMKKEYLGLIHGRMRQTHGLIQAPLGRVDNSLILRQFREDGAMAMTIWQEVRWFPTASVSLVRFRLLSGRTHQIRVHCQTVGHPLLGDGLYGLAETDRATVWDHKIGRQALHAARLGFEHPLTHQWIERTAPLPDDMRLLLRQLSQKNTD